MRRREFIAGLGGAVAAWPLPSHAQQPAKAYRVGTLSAGPAMADQSPNGIPLVRGFAQLSYTQNGDLVFERRGAEGHIDRLPRLVEELAAAKVDLIVTFGYPAALAAKQGTTIPVVSFGAGDPVGTGLVRAWHGRAATSPASRTCRRKSLPSAGTSQRVAPGLRRVAMLWNADDLGMTLRYRASEAGANEMGISVQPLGVREPDDFDKHSRQWIVKCRMRFSWSRTHSPSSTESGFLSLRRHIGFQRPTSSSSWSTTAV